MSALEHLYIYYEWCVGPWHGRGNVPFKRGEGIFSIEKIWRSRFRRTQGITRAAVSEDMVM